MIKTVLQKVLPVLAVIYIIGYFLIFCFYLIFPPAIVFPAQHVAYISQVSFLAFIELLIPITCTGLLIAYSLFLTEDDMLSKRGTAHPFHRAVTPMLFLLLFFSLVYAFLITWSYSLTLRSVNSVLYNTRLVTSYLDTAVQWEKQGQYQDALRLLDACILLDYHNKKARELRDKIQSHLANLTTGNAGSGDMENRMPEDGLTVEEMFRKARTFFYKEDWFSSYYYASLAYKTDPELTEAADLARKAMERISSFGLTIADTEKQQLYQEKQTAYEMLSIRKDYLSAYYLFNKLKKETPADPDIDAYLEYSRNKVKEISFFYEDCAFPLSLPGTEDIFFVNYNSSERKEFVFIKKMINYNGQYFFQDIEVIEINGQGRITLHFKAKYGKYYYTDLPVKTKGVKEDTMHHVLMYCVGKDNQELQFRPEYLAAPPYNTDTANILKLAPDPAWLGWLCIHPQKYRLTGINELFDLKQYLARFGYPETEVNIEIVTRLTLPLLFFLFSIFAIAIGWLYRSRYSKRPPVAAILLIPLLPVATSILCNVLFFLNRIFIVFSIDMFGFTLSLITGAVVLFVLLLTALFLIAGMVSKQ